MLSEAERTYVWKILERQRSFHVERFNREGLMLERIYAGVMEEIPGFELSQIHSIRECILSDIKELRGYIETPMARRHLPKTTVSIFRNTEERTAKIDKLYDEAKIGKNG